MTSIFNEIYSSVDTLQSLTIGFMVTLIVSFGLRVYTRLRILHIFEAEDWTMIIAVLFAIAAGVTTLVDIPLMRKGALSVSSGSLVLTTVIASLVADIATRISFGFFFLTIYARHRNYRLFIWTTMLTVLIAGIVAIPFSVIHGKGQLGLEISSKIYAARGPYISFIVYVTMVVWGDFTLTILSIWTLYKIRLPVAAKFSAGVLLIIQCLAGVASVARIVFVIKVRQHGQDILRSTPAIVHLAQWSYSEIALGIITANLALTRPLFVYVFRRLRGETVITARPGRSTFANEALESKNSGHKFGRGSFEITKTQVITVAEEMESKGLEGLERTGLIGNTFVEVSRS